MSKSAINPNRKISGLSEIRDARYPLQLDNRMPALSDMMQELEARLNANSDAETNALYAQLDEIEMYEPTESEIEEMYSARDLEDVGCSYMQALNDSF